MAQLSAVDAVFSIRGRGVVVSTGIPADYDSPLAIGDALLLKRPYGSEVKALVAGIIALRGDNPNPRSAPIDRAILIGPEVSKDAVPVGTELWIP